MHHQAVGRMRKHTSTRITTAPLFGAAWMTSPFFSQYFPARILTTSPAVTSLFWLRSRSRAVCACDPPFMHFFYRAVTASNVWVAPLYPAALHHSLPHIRTHWRSLTPFLRILLFFFSSYLLCAFTPLHRQNRAVYSNTCAIEVCCAILQPFELHFAYYPRCFFKRFSVGACSCRCVSPSVHLLATSFRCLNTTVYSVIPLLRPPAFRSIFAHYRPKWSVPPFPHRAPPCRLHAGARQHVPSADGTCRASATATEYAGQPTGSRVSRLPPRAH